MAFDLGSFIGANIGETVARIVGLFKVSPEQQLQAQVELSKIQGELQAKLNDAVTAEINQAGEIIKAEAQSQSWLPRNVRPLLLLVWGSLITLNFMVPIIARFWIPDFAALVLDPWVYKLTAIGFTGYVTARTWEKVTSSE